MLTGVESGFNLRGVGLHALCLRALGARMVSSTIWFVTDVPKLTIGGAAGRRLKSLQMAPCSSGWVGVGWMGVLARVWVWPVVVEYERKDCADLDLIEQVRV